MFKNIDIYKIYTAQITIAFMVIASIERSFHIPHGVWFITTSSMAYAALHPGLIFKSAYLRLTGTLLGVATATLIWAIIHIDYRFALIILFITMWSLIFFVGASPSRYMITIVVFSDLVIEWTNTDTFFLEYYVIDRTVCIILVFAVCIVLEYLWFGSESMTELHYQYLCQQIRRDLNAFYRLTNEKNLKRSDIFKILKHLNQQLDELSSLINDYTYEHKHRASFIKDANVISNILVQEFRKILCCFYLKHRNIEPKRLETLRLEIEHSLNQPLKDFLDERAPA